MTNPYEPPKAVQQPAPRKPDFFARAQKYQWRAFYSGLVLCIAGALLPSPAAHPLLMDIPDLLGVAGAVLLFLSLGSILPLAVWGFVVGYRESGRR